MKKILLDTLWGLIPATIIAILACIAIIPYYLTLKYDNPNFMLIYGIVVVVILAAFLGAAVREETKR